LLRFLRLQLSRPAHRPTSDYSAGGLRPDAFGRLSLCVCYWSCFPQLLYTTMKVRVLDRKIKIYFLWYHICMRTPPPIFIPILFSIAIIACEVRVTTKVDSRPSESQTIYGTTLRLDRNSSRWSRH
jgi:hypothetical protein